MTSHSFFILQRKIILSICRYTFNPCFRIARSTSNFNADGHLLCQEYNYTPSTKTPRKTQITASRGHTQSVMNFGVLIILSRNIIFLICRYTFSPCFRIARSTSNFNADGHLPCREYNYTPSTKTPRKTQITASRGHTHFVLDSSPKKESTKEKILRYFHKIIRMFQILLRLFCFSRSYL